MPTEYRDAVRYARNLVLKTIRDNPGRNERYLARAVSRSINVIADAHLLRAVINLGEYTVHSLIRTGLEDYQGANLEDLDPKLVEMIKGAKGLLWDADGDVDLGVALKLTEDNFALLSALIADDRMNAIESAIMIMQYRLKAVEKVMTKLTPYIKEDADHDAVKHIIEVNEGVASEED